MPAHLQFDVMRSFVCGHNNINDLYSKINYLIDFMSGLFEPKVIVKNTFTQTLESLKKANLRLPDNPDDGGFDDSDDGWVDGRVNRLENEEKYCLDVKNGVKVSKNPETMITAYDESIEKYKMLAGMAQFTSHALVLSRAEDYAAITMLTANFYSKSKDVCEKAGIKVSNDAKRDALIDKVKDEIAFICQYTPDNSIILIDGPLIAGDAYTYMIAAQPQFIEKHSLPVFFVKNSNSNLVLDYSGAPQGKYNSDMHWADMILKPGERTAFYKYTDKINERNTKVFCYLKFFNESSPVRIEFYSDLFFLNKTAIDNVMDLILYLIYCQGDLKNPQVRPIAVAEMYARESLNLVNVHNEMKKTGLTPTMNEARGMMGEY